VSDYDDAPVIGVPEQTEQDVREIEREYDQPPDEPHPRYDDDSLVEFVTPNDEFGHGLGEVDGQDV
jgi:hypothetical protein